MVRIEIKYIFAVIVAIYAALFFIIPLKENLPADPGVKLLQVKDLIKKDFRSLSAVYNGEKLDPDKKFNPIKQPMGHVINNEIYYVFPFYLTLLYAPIYYFFGLHGIIFLTMLAGLSTILVGYEMARLLQISEQNIKLMLIFLGLASIIPLYCYMLGEYTLSIFLVTLSVYLVLLGNEKRNSILYFLAGLSAGCSVYFRIELGLYCILLLLGVVIFKIYSEPMKQVPALFLSLVICAVVLVSCNYYVTGNIFGLRGVEFLSKSGGSYALSERLLRLFNAFFFSKMSIGLFIAWPIYFFLFGLLIRKNRAEEDISALRFILLIVMIFFFSIPFLVNIGDGSILGPRYLATFQPVLALSVFKILDFKNMKTKAKRIVAMICIVYSCIIMIMGFIILYKVTLVSDDVNKKISGHVKSNIVILYDSHLSYSVLRLFNDRIIFCINPSKDWNSVLTKIGKAGIRDLSVIDFAKEKDAISYPFKAPFVQVESRFTYDGGYKKTIVENIRINY